MSTFSRFLPFLKPYLSRMVVAGLLVMGVAAINLALLRLAGNLWDIITVQHDRIQDDGHDHRLSRARRHAGALFDGP